MKKVKKILFTGGGTGGHLFPIISVVREIKKISPTDFRFYFIGPGEKLAKELLPKEGIKTIFVLTGKIRRYLNFLSFFQNLIDLVKIPIGIFQAFLYIFFINPDLIFSKGGFGSIPAVVAGWILRVPIFLHESDAVPGLANRFLIRFATEIFTSFPTNVYFPKFPLNKIVLVGNPVREELLKDLSKKRGREYFKIKGEKPVLLILGGSQGAQRINEKILQILPEMLKDFEVIHQTGKRNFDEIKIIADNILPKELREFYHPVPFLKETELRDAFTVSDFVISRAGAGSIFEIALFEKPSILIPLPEAAQDHQTENAYRYAENGATMVLEEENFTPHFLLERIRFLFSHPGELEKMRIAAKNFAKPQAAKIIATYLVEFLTR